MRKIFPMILCLLMVSAVAWAQESTTEDPVIARAGDIEIRASELNRVIETLPDDYQAYAKGPGKKTFAEDYIRMRLLAAEAERTNLDEEPEVREQLDMMRQNTLATAQLDKVKSGLMIDEDAIRAAYEDRKGELERTTARHILIAFEGSPVLSGEEGLSEEAAKAKAEELRKQIVEGGADFAELATAESNDRGSAARGGQVGTFGRGQMVPEFEKYAFETPVGEISPVFRTRFGYHFLEVENRGPLAFEEVREQIASEQLQAKVESALEAMEAEAGVTMDESFFAPPAESEASVEPAIEPEG